MNTHNHRLLQFERISGNPFLLGLIDILALTMYICFNDLNPIFDLIIIICHETRLLKRLPINKGDL